MLRIRKFFWTMLRRLSIIWSTVGSCLCLRSLSCYNSTSEWLKNRKGFGVAQSKSRLKPHELKQLNTDQTGQTLFLTELCKLFNLFSYPFSITLCESSLFTRSIWQLLYRCLESYFFIIIIIFYCPVTQTVQRIQN